MKRHDVVALVSGTVLSAVAVVALWLSFTGTVSWQLIGVVGPLGLVTIGILGLVLSRQHD